MIAVNATVLAERPTGLGVYATGLIDALRERGEALDVIRLPSPRGHAARIAWLQVVLPLRLARSRPRALLNVVPEGPLRSPVPQVTVVHDLIPLFYPAPSRFPRAHLYFRYVAPLLLRASRTVVADSEATKRDVVGHYGIAAERIAVVYPGYDRARFRRAARPSAPADAYLLYVGNVAPHKNLGRLIDAFARVATRSSARLVIRGWGRPWHVEPVRRRIEEAGIGARVDWRPYEDAATLPDLYRGARALVLPSLYEGFGLTALEAMACGTPVVAARAASIPEVVGDAAVLVDPLDVDGLTAGMAELLAAGARADELRERGLARAELFSWERTARGVAEVIRAAIA